jgi:hypothetical protein
VCLPPLLDRRRQKVNLAEIVRSVLDLIRASGAEPFIIPAMGSHGGATPHGQQNVLAGLGITLESTQVPLDTSMDVAEIGTFADDYPLVFSRAALKADAVVVINRIKPHTDFFGNLGSGIQKMLVIGFGKHIGASNAHRAAILHGHEVVIREAAKVILEKVPVLFAVAILEDQHHQTHDLHVIRGDQILLEEDALFVRSQQLLPRLPFPNIDLLIVDEIGKENLLRQTEVAIANGKTTAQACKEAEIVEQTYFRLAKGIRRVTDRPGEAVDGVGAGECEAETPCRQSEPGQAGVEGHRVGKLLSPERRRRAVSHACEHGMSERRACFLMGQPRGTQRYRPTRREDEDRLTQAIIQLASQYGRYGYRRITALLQRAGKD